MSLDGNFFKVLTWLPGWKILNSKHLAEVKKGMWRLYFYITSQVIVVPYTLYIETWELSFSSALLGGISEEMCDAGDPVDAESGQKTALTSLSSLSSGSYRAGRTSAAQPEQKEEPHCFFLSLCCDFSNPLRSPVTKTMP